MTILEQINKAQDDLSELKSAWGSAIAALDGIESDLKEIHQKTIEYAVRNRQKDRGEHLSNNECLEHLRQSGWWAEHELAVETKVNGAYKRGVDEGRKQAKAQADPDVCQKGSDDVWKCVEKLVSMPYTQRSEIFDGVYDILSIVQKYSPAEAAARLREYEERQNQIKTGDEVRNKLSIMDGATGFFVETLEDGCSYKVLRRDGEKISIALWAKGNCVKTGRHSDTVEKLIAEIKGGAG